MSAGRHNLVIASNRGPVSFTRGDDGGLLEQRGVGGLVTAVSGAAGTTAMRWLSMPMSQTDRDRADDATPITVDALPSVTMGFIDIDPLVYETYYEAASNRAIWFGLHGLEELPMPDEAWKAYVSANAAMADAIATQAAHGAKVLVQDYHLCLVPGMLTAQRPDLRVGMTWHVPFPEPARWDAIPHADELLDGLDAAHVVTFHSRRWATRFESCGATHARVRVAPLGVDAASLLADANTPEVGAHRPAIAALRDRPLLVRADRVEPAKGVPAGLLGVGLALEALGRDAFRHLIRLTPSRLRVPEYAAELDRIRSMVEELNAPRPEDPVVILEVSDDRPRTFAALREADAILITSLADGMNLVAREAPLINEHDAPLILSIETGAADVFSDAALRIDPRDPAAIAAAIIDAVTMDPSDRIARAAQVRAAAAGIGPGPWMRDQFAAL